jgi:signal transduction histidine kinase
MKKRQYYAIAAIFLFFGLGAALDFGITKEDHLKSYARRIERSLQKKEVEVEVLLTDTGFIFRQLRGIEKLPSIQQEADLKRLLALTSKPYNLTMYREDSLVFWLNNKAFLGEEHVNLLQDHEDACKLIRLPNGYFELIKKDLTEGVMVAALIPIKKQYARKSEFLTNRFITEDFTIPEDVFLTESPTAFSIENIQGKDLAWLDATGPAKDKFHLKMVFFIYLLGFIALGWLINDLAIMLVQRYKPWVGAAFILGAVAIVRWATMEMGFTQHFASFQTFSPVFIDRMLDGVGSLGELLINIVLLVWMMVFFNREFLVKEFAITSLPIRFALTTLNFFAVIFGMLMVCGIFKSIVRDSEIVFDFENVFNLNSQSVLAMIGMVLLLLALFLFSHRMMLSIHKIGMNKRWRIPAMVVSLVGALPVVKYAELELPLLLFLSAATIYLLFFEFFIESRRTSLGWMVSWLIIYSMFTSLLLYKYNDDKDFSRRSTYAKALADFKDEVAETELADLGNLLAQDMVIRQLERIYRNNLPDKIPKEEVREIIDARLGTFKYLLHNYGFDISGFNVQDGSIAFKDQVLSWGQMEEQFQKALPTSFPNLRFNPEKTREPGYLMRLSVPSKTDLLYFLKFNRKFSSPSKVYTELLLDKKYKNLGELDSYDYGIYQDGKLVEERNKSYGKQLTDNLPPVGQIKVLTHTSRRSELLYHAPENIAIKIGRDTGGYIKPLSLFSYVFTMLAIAVLLFAGINYFINALPGPLNFFRSMKPSLRNQFQIWVIGMILFSFLGIGFVTVWYFQQSSNEYHKGRLDRKVTSALANVNYEIKAWHREQRQEHEIEEKIAQRIEKELGIKERVRYEQEEKENEKRRIDALSLTSLVPLISEVHRLDVNIYDLKGNLTSSSEEDIFKHGLIAPKMGAHAFQVLTKLGFERSDQDESIGDLDYLAAYVPLKNLEGKALAFMGIPYYARQRELRSEVTDFMSTLLNVYVFLLLIAGGLAIFIANSITKALVNLSENLRRLRLRANQPLDYKRKDEIGDLVVAYNRAIQELDESSRLLAQSEREGAWREMAKQVAHEIKNPLTPMKLSIQYLLHAYKANANNIEPLLNRVAATLVEQIESLAQIATEFSNFAKMPVAENADFSISDLAASVHHLFANERPDMQITLTIPEDKDFIVFADRNHLTRVLNNLFKNAIQAIPDGKHGIIDLSIYQEEEKVVLKVSDNGSGIPPAIQEKVFVPNFSTKTSGTGLGLAICKSIIESFNGHIRFETEEGVGTTFFVELPLYEVQLVEHV